MNAATNYQRLINRLTFISSRTFHTNKVFREHSQLADICIEYLKSAHRIAQATVPLMQEVIHSAQSFNNDPVCAPLITYMKKHIAEEMHHDKWYINDLKSISVTEQEVLAQIPSPNIAAMIGSQYYWVKHQHPVAFMGYITALEANPPTEAYVNELIKNSKLPASAFDTLMLHAQIDVNHKEDIIQVLNDLPLTEEQFNLIEMSAFQSYRYLAFIMEDICRTAPTLDQ